MSNNSFYRRRSFVGIAFSTLVVSGVVMTTPVGANAAEMVLGDGSDSLITLPTPGMTIMPGGTIPSGIPIPTDITIIFPGMTTTTPVTSTPPVTTTPAPTTTPVTSTPPVTTTPAPTTTEPVPPSLTMDLATVNGSGCPAGTAAVAVSPDREAFTVTYSKYISEMAGERDRNCQLSMVVNVPGGFTYAVASADYRGFADLADGSKGILFGTYYFGGEKGTAYTQHDLVGPFTDNWQFTDEVGYADQVWHPCGAKRNLNANTRLLVSGKAEDKTSYLSMDSTDVNFSTKYHFSWATC